MDAVVLEEGDGDEGEGVPHLVADGGLPDVDGVAGDELGFEPVGPECAEGDADEAVGGSNW